MAFSFFKRIFSKGTKKLPTDPQELYELGMAYYEGERVEQDFEKAAQLRDIESNYAQQLEIERDNSRRTLQQNRGSVTAEDIARAKNLEFERAAYLRDRINEIQEELAELD